MRKKTLFLFSYAGATASFYHRWKQYFPDGIRIIPVELPGRGMRINEPLNQDFPSTLEDVIKRVSPYAFDGQYGIYGHSMGAWIAYETASYLEKVAGKKPAHLFLSGRLAPHLLKNEKKYTTLSDEEFISELADKGGTPQEIIDSDDFRQFFLPIIRSDYGLLESYRFSNRGQLETDITFFSSKSDYAVDRSLAREWGQYTFGNFRILDFIGDHFFLHDQAEKMAEIMKTVLLN